MKLKNVEVGQRFTTADGTEFVRIEGINQFKNAFLSFADFKVKVFPDGELEVKPVGIEKSLGDKLAENLDKDVMINLLYSALKDEFDNVPTYKVLNIADKLIKNGLSFNNSQKEQNQSLENNNILGSKGLVCIDDENGERKEYNISELDGTTLERLKMEIEDVLASVSGRPGYSKLENFNCLYDSKFLIVAEYDDSPRLLVEFFEDELVDLHNEVCGILKDFENNNDKSVDNLLKKASERCEELSSNESGKEEYVME